MCNDDNDDCTNCFLCALGVARIINVFRKTFLFISLLYALRKTLLKISFTLVDP